MAYTCIPKLGIPTQVMLRLHSQRNQRLTAVKHLIGMLIKPCVMKESLAEGGYGTALTVGADALV